MISKEDLLKIEWSLPLDECHEYNSGAWLRIAEKSFNQPRNNQTQQQILFNKYIRGDCLTKNDLSSIVSYEVHYRSNETSSDKDCHFALLNELEECKIYSVDVFPEYNSLKGQVQSTEIIIPIGVSDLT